MAGHIVYWSKDYVTKLQKKGDKGPFKVVYGSQHQVMPSISSVKVGDIIYPVTIMNGTLAVMARLQVEKIECAFDYTMRELGTYHSALIPKGVLYYTEGVYGDFVMWEGGSGYVVDDKTVKYNGIEGEIVEKLPDNIKQIYHSDMLNEIPHLPHQEPQTCCAKFAASGNGSEIYPRLIPIETVKTMLFGKNKASPKPLRFDKNDRIMTTSVSAFVRKMSDETFEIFESLFSTASTENCLELR